MPPRPPPPLGFPRIELVQHSRKYAINYNRAALHTTLPMLIARLYRISNRRSRSNGSRKNTRCESSALPSRVTSILTKRSREVRTRFKKYLSLDATRITNV